MTPHSKNANATKPADGGLLDINRREPIKWGKARRYKRLCAE
jgi:hypothetical protein